MKKIILFIILAIIIAWLTFLLFLFNSEFPNMGMINSAAYLYIGKEIVAMFYKE